MYSFISKWFGKGGGGGIIFATCFNGNSKQREKQAQKATKKDSDFFPLQYFFYWVSLKGNKVGEMRHVQMYMKIILVWCSNAST